MSLKLVQPSFEPNGEFLSFKDFLECLYKDTGRIDDPDDHLQEQTKSLSLMIQGFEEYKKRPHQFYKDTQKSFSNNKKSIFKSLPIFLQGFFLIDKMHSLQLRDLLAVPPVPIINNEQHLIFAKLYKEYLAVLRKNYRIFDVFLDIPENIKRDLLIDYLPIKHYFLFWEKEVDRRIRLYEMKKFQISHSTHKVAILVRLNNDKIRRWLLDFYKHHKKVIKNNFASKIRYKVFRVNNTSDIEYNMTLGMKIQHFLSELHYLSEFTYSAEIISEKVHDDTADELFLQRCLEHIGLIRNDACDLEETYQDDTRYEVLDDLWHEIQEAIHYHAYEIASTHALNGFRDLIIDFSSQGITPFTVTFRGENILWEGYPVEPFKYKDILSNSEYIFVIQKFIDIMVMRDHEDPLNYDELYMHAQCLTALLDIVKFELRAKQNEHSSMRLLDLVDHLQHRFVVHKRTNSEDFLFEFLINNINKFGKNKFVEKLKEKHNTSNLISKSSINLQDKKVSNDK